MNIIINTFILLCLQTTLGQKLVDLGHDLSDTTPIFPLPLYAAHPFKLTVLHAQNTSKGFWLAYNSLCTIEHIGTHIDAPYHFYEHGWTLDQIPIERFITRAAVIDISHKVQNNSNYELSSEDVDVWLAANGQFPNHCVILIRTGWSTRYPDQAAYYGHSSDHTKVVSPGVHPEAVKKILDLQKTQGINILGFGIDAPSIDNGPSLNYMSHQIIQAENQYILENLNNLDQVPATGAVLFVMPMKIKGGTGGPARVIAQLPK